MRKFFFVICILLSSSIFAGSEVPEISDISDLGVLADQFVFEREELERYDRSEPERFRTVEKEEFRSGSTRVWENQYKIPLLDKETGLPSGKYALETQKVYEKGSGLNYNIAPEGATPEWTLTDNTITSLSKDGYSFGVETGPSKAYWKSSSSDYQMKFQTGDHSLRSGLYGLGYYDESLDQTVIFDYPANVLGVKSGNKVIYSGVFTGIDLEC